MTQTVPSVPEHVTRAQVNDLVSALGINPDDLLTLTLTCFGLSVEVRARRGDGTEIPSATHRLHVRVEER